jgi:hypothetical protein
MLRRFKIYSFGLGHLCLKEVENLTLRYKYEPHVSSGTSCGVVVPAPTSLALALLITRGPSPSHDRRASIGYVINIYVQR